MLDRRWRQGVERGLGPLGRGLRSLGVPADALTQVTVVARTGTQADALSTAMLVSGRRPPGVQEVVLLN